MKHLIICLCMLLLATNIVAQERELLPVDWQLIRKEVKDNPQYIKDLVARLSANKLDTTLTYQERILAFYGQSFLTNDEEETLISEMFNQKKQGEMEKCLTTAKKVLSINPLHLQALDMVAQTLYAMAKDSIRGTEVEDAKPYLNRAMRIFNTIAKTGDGSEEHPFYVTKVSDEYCFMRYYLDLWDYKTQEATSCCDVFTLNGTSDYYNQPKIYFEITRVYELERMLFLK